MYLWNISPQSFVFIFVLGALSFFFAKFIPTSIINGRVHALSHARDYVGCICDLTVNGNRYLIKPRRTKLHNVVDGCAVGSHMDTCGDETCVNFVADDKP